METIKGLIRVTKGLKFAPSEIDSLLIENELSTLVLMGLLLMFLYVGLRK